MSKGKQEMSAVTRRKLIDAAIELIGRQGYRETSLQDIAELAGISRGSIGWHFGSKAGLLAHIAEFDVREWLAQMQSTDGEPSRTRLANWIGQYSQAIQQDAKRTAVLTMLLMEAIGPRNEIRDEYAQLHREVRESIAQCIRFDQADGRIDSSLDADATAAMVFGALIGIHLQWRLDPDAVDFATGTSTLARVVEGLTSTPRRAAARRR